MKRVVIAHGWADDPNVGWLNWLGEQLKQRGFEVSKPVFTEPDPKAFNLERWCQVMSEAVGAADEQTVLLGHSLGCYLVMQYLSSHDVKVAGIVLVAGGLPTWRPELAAQLDLEAIPGRASRRICIYSDDDRVVVPERSQELAQAIKAEEVVDAGKRHFAGLKGLNELPSALEAVLSCYA